MLSKSSGEWKHEKLSIEFVETNDASVANHLMKWAGDHGQEPHKFDIFAKKNPDGSFTPCNEDDNPSVIFRNCSITSIK